MKLILLFLVILSFSLLLKNNCFGQINFIDSGQNIGDTLATCAALGDLDNDGDLDLFITYGQYNLPVPNKVFLNDGHGKFSDSGQLLGNRKSYSVSLGDVDNDNDLDAFIANGDYDRGDSNEVWINDGKGNFRLGSVIGRTNGTGNLTDLDNDGDLDIFICNHPLSNGSNGGHRIYLNNGYGNFTDTGQRLGSSEGRSAVFGDIDKDGDIDVAAGSYNDGNRLYLNDGHGIFTYSNFSFGTVESRMIAFGDLDNDSNLDAFVSHMNNSPSLCASNVWLNSPNGKFTDTGQKLGDYPTLAVALADLDNDGDLDAFLANGRWTEGKPNTVWINDGTGHFTDSGLRLGNDESSSVVLGDLDKDGDIDAVIVNRTSPGKVYLNSLKDNPTGIENQKSGSINYNLFQNYPNPFNPSTAIEYELSKSSDVKLKIYDTLGQEIKILVNSFQKAGKYTVTWNAIDNKSNPVSSGIYFYSLETDKNTLQKKMILIR